MSRQPYRTSKVIQGIDRVVLFLNYQAVIWMTGVMAVMVMANVVLRFTAGESIQWAEEVSRYLMIWVTFLGSGILFRQGAHIAVDNLQDIVPKKIGKMIRITVIAILLAFFAVMIVLGSMYTLRQWGQLTPVTRISSGFVYGALPVGFGLMAYHVLMIAIPWAGSRSFTENVDDQVFGAD